MPLRKLSHLEFIKLSSCILFLSFSLLPSPASYLFPWGHLQEHSISSTWGFICCSLFSLRIPNPGYSLHICTHQVWGASGRRLYVTSTMSTLSASESQEPTRIAAGDVWVVETGLWGWLPCCLSGGISSSALDLLTNAQLSTCVECGYSPVQWECCANLPL